MAEFGVRRRALSDLLLGEVRIGDRDAFGAPLVFEFFEEVGESAVFLGSTIDGEGVAEEEGGRPPLPFVVVVVVVNDGDCFEDR